MDFQHLIIKLIQLMFFLCLGGLIAATIFCHYLLELKPTLAIWHTVPLTEEFSDQKSVHTFEQYLALEQRLFKELDTKIIAQFSHDNDLTLNRYNTKSLSSPNRFTQNWNQSFELIREEPKAGILLLHGLSDSPYTLRTLGQTFHRNQAYVVGLRLPGHGTCPSGLLNVKWQDMQNSVEFALDHLQQKVNNKPIYIVGYSNGGTLALLQAIKNIKTQKHNLQGIVLISPQIAISPLADYASYQEKFGALFRLPKARWLNVGPEYNPFKYNSFTINAVILANTITQELQTQLKQLHESKQTEKLPDILTFQSLVDATVSTQGLVENYSQYLDTDHHEVVFFDINRKSRLASLINFYSHPDLLELLQNQKSAIRTKLITNVQTNSNEVMALAWQKQSSEWTKQELDLYWPNNVYSLSHVALAIHASDEVYGKGGDGSQLSLSTLAQLGEKGIVQIPSNELLRLKWNPFYRYIEERCLSFTNLAY